MGSVVSGVFADVNWGTGDNWLKVEMPIEMKIEKEKCCEDVEMLIVEPMKKIETYQYFNIQMN